jgi:hypothetical protein
MNWANLLGKWTMRTIHGGILAAALLGSASAVAAQTTGASASAAAVPKNFTKSLTFDLPVRMDPASRAELSEIRLFVKAPGGQWKLQEQGLPNLDRFKCRVPQDGEYWYSLVVVDRQGRATPADVNLEAPSQRVIVDTAAPIIQVQANNVPGGELCLQCTILDANPDPSSLRAVCRTEIGDVNLEPSANQPNSFKIRSEMMRYPVIVSVSDQAKNIATKEVNLRELLGTAGGPAGGTTTGHLPTKTPNDIALAGNRPDQRGPQGIGPIDLPKNDAPILKNESPGAIGANHRVELPPPPANNLPTDIASKPPVMTTDVAPRGSARHQLINTTSASLEYKIDQVGPSGVGKVEVYMTPDNGQSWHKLGEDTDKQSPAQITLPGDGVYGIRIVVSNGNGFGGKAPIRGDAPQCTIEVDTLSPFVQLRSADVHPTAGHVEIRWNATDKNLGGEPVTLSCRSRVDGPWQVIAKNVKNDGLYRWAFPRDAAGQYYFKVEVTDEAGNVAQDISRQPIVIDISEPRATVVGVVGNSAPRPAPAPVVGGGNP